MSANSNPLTILPDGEKFDGAGFVGFETKFLAVADARGLRGYIEGTIVRPGPAIVVTPAPVAGTASTVSTTPPAPQSVPIPPDPTSIYSTTPSLDEWRHRDGMAKALIVLNVKDPVGLGLKTDGTAAEAWDSLVTNHKRVNQMALIQARRELVTTFLQPGTPIQEHVALLRNLHRKANDQGAKVNDEEFRTIFIGYTPLTSSAEVISLVVMHADRLSSRVLSTSSTTQALATNTRDSRRAARKNLICSNSQCGAPGKRGHTIEDCFWLGGGKAGQWPAWWKGKKPGTETTANAVETYVFSVWTVPAATIDVYDTEGTQAISFRGEDFLASPETLMTWTEAADATIPVEVPQIPNDGSSVEYLESDASISVIGTDTESYASVGASDAGMPELQTLDTETDLGSDGDRSDSQSDCSEDDSDSDTYAAMRGREIEIADILRASQPYPGDVDDVDNTRFVVYRTSDTEHVLVDSMANVDTRFPSKWVDDPDQNWVECSPLFRTWTKSSLTTPPMSNLSREPRRLLSKQQQRYERSQHRRRQPEIRSVKWEPAAVLGLLLLLLTLATLSLAVLSFVELLGGDMCLVIGELLALRCCSVLQLGAWRKLCSRNKDLTQPRPPFFDSEHFKRPRIYRVVMLGPFRRPIDLLVLASSSTVDDALCEPPPPPYPAPQANYNHRAVPRQADLSTLHVRYAVCGGSHWQGSNSASTSGTNSDARPSSDSAMDVDDDVPSDNVWTYLPDLDRYSCGVCPGSIMKWKRLQEHEASDKHQRALERLAQREAESSSAPADASSTREVHAPVVAAARGTLQNILQQIKDGASAEDTWVNPETGVVDWSSSAMMDAFLAARLEEFLNEETVEVGSDDEDAERSDGESSTESHDPLPFLPGRKSRKVNLDAERPASWDVLRHIPRCSFSKKQNAAIHWAMLALGLKDLPSDRVMDDIDKALQPLCGIQSIRYAGKLGHVYYTNDFAAIIAQEMANPSVRKHLRFLPEENGSKLAEAWQAKRWLYELDSDLTTPMHRIGSQDFYVHEPAILQSGNTCIPTRWFERNGQVYARVWRMQQVTDRNGWVVDTSQTHDVPATQFLVAFPAFIAIHDQRNLADPRLINGVSSAPNTELSPWTYTNPLYGNRWRSQAKGHRVIAFPVWLYCDDTSAGLPRRLVHLESNIHFLATSNIAPPLEMLDGIVDQLCSAQARGIWAWDSVLNEIVLVIPSVLAMLGDNPMQSEFACHIGFRGKFFCRVCRVQGDPADDEDDDEDGGGLRHSQQLFSQQCWERGTRDEEQAGSQEEEDRKKSPVRCRDGQPYHAVHEADWLATVNTPATNSNLSLRLLHLHGVVPGKNLRYLHEKKIPKEQKQAMVNAFRATLPAELTSPVWRIKDLDPTQDTPVEILHVILLGFVKYFWRDAIARLKAPEKAILSARLTSFDVSGLGISPLSGHTLVDYAGSLTGRDFRAIAQAAPFVLHGLLEKERVQTWAALGAIVSLVWQPEIRNLDAYITELEQAIDHFLDCACSLSLNWFNKPKFHVVLHLPAHIRRFGPAMLFATEGFESYNAIIRACSIHSNRHAPSRDIAWQMARSNRVRHLLNGGLLRRPPTAIFEPASITDLDSPWMRIPLPALEQSRWLSAGQHPLGLLAKEAFGARFFGITTHETELPGLCAKKGPVRLWSETKASACHAQALDPNTIVRTPEIVVLANGDSCGPGNHVAFSNPLAIGRVEEIIQRVGSNTEKQNTADFILISKTIVGESHAVYGTRLLQHLAECVAVPVSAVACTVNVQHNCVDNRCELSRTKEIRQERELVKEKAMEVAHRSSPSQVNWLVNTHQMRDASVLMEFRAKPAGLNRMEVVQAAAEVEFAARQTKTAAAAAKAAIPRPPDGAQRISNRLVVKKTAPVLIRPPFTSALFPPLDVAPSRMSALFPSRKLTLRLSHRQIAHFTQDENADIRPQQFPNLNTTWSDSPGIPSSDDFQFAPTDTQGVSHAAQFVDAVANDKGLTAEQRFDLHAYRTLDPDLKMVYLLACIMKQQTDLGKVHAQYKELGGVMEKLMDLVGQSITVSDDQRTDVNAAAKQLIVDPKRVNYDNDSVTDDVIAHLKQHLAVNGFKSFFEANAHAKLKALTGVIRHGVSYAKSTQRNIIKDNLSNCLTVATTSLVRKMTGSIESISVNNVIRMAIFRRFARDHPELLSIEETTEPTGTTTSTTGRKRGRPAKRVRTSEEQSYWGKFSAFMKDKVEEWGNDYKAPQWAAYIDPIIQQERQRFVNDPIQLLPQVLPVMPATQTVGSSSVVGLNNIAPVNNSFAAGSSSHYVPGYMLTFAASSSSSVAGTSTTTSVNNSVNNGLGGGLGGFGNPATATTNTGFGNAAPTGFSTMAHNNNFSLPSLSQMTQGALQSGSRANVAANTGGAFGTGA
ncbi:hypothetical protein HMN09_00340300 [Mycena chlorophos]|uniref:Uncharacterized protein n=1 Tax=Mycena chlorophos TaxID=658473 RepID=A0A8H6TIR2_MYCCL|nr:hypothetical protein HMN09_00340300 [Mycena chlorophos]